MKGYAPINISRLKTIGPQYDRLVFRIYHGDEGECCVCKGIKPVLKFNISEAFPEAYSPEICRECSDKLFKRGEDAEEANHSC